MVSYKALNTATKLIADIIRKQHNMSIHQLQLKGLITAPW